MKHTAALMMAAAIGCSSSPPKPTDPNAILSTLNDLAVFGNKRVGTEPGRQAGEYVLSRMQKLGLTSVHMESFQFPRHVVDAQALAATVDGAAMSPAFEVFEGSGAGHADADVVYVGTAHPSEVAAVDLRGKIA
ncbi:MAG TPA: hypothetical protein VHB97_23750, partial [Polyangia bacterium]|nr:hypothetical protein [Polyangia bacterium]